MFKINNVEITWLGHAGFMLEYAGFVIYIDPYVLADRDFEKADFIIITHEHYDHCNVDIINKLSDDKTKIIAPPACISKLERDINIILSNQKKVLEGFEIKSVPAYNIEKSFHPKNSGNGYILTLGETKIYHAGDTDFIPEMIDLASEQIDIALLPVGGTYTMDIKQAVKAVEAIKPKAVFPMHYGTIANTSADIEKFKQLLTNRGINVNVYSE